MNDPQAPWYYQNNVAALKVLELLDFGSLIENVSLDNYEKGKHIDDIIVEYRNGFIRYFQVKWSKDEDKSYTLYNMIEPQSQQKGKSLFRELAEGYLSLPNKDTIEIVLYTKRVAGNNKQKSKGLDKGFLDFIDDIHEPFIDSEFMLVSELPLYADYKNIIDKVKKASGITDDEDFSNFLKKLRFEFSQPDTEIQKEKVYAKLDRLGIEKSKYEKLLDCIVNWSFSHENNEREIITLDKVKKALGIADRFIDSVNHEFPVNEDYYIENSSVFNQLDNAVKNLSSGFILLQGLPGSGKSTALTIYKQKNKNIKFAYHCFNPDEKSLGNKRMEKETFIKSLCIGIQNSFPDIEFSKMYSGDYEGKLNEYLYKLSEQNEKIVFIIDGLDHVDRKHKEGVLTQPLTAFIDNNLPENILFILSSQYPEALSNSVQAQITENPLCHIIMEKFTHEEVGKYLQKRKIDVDPNIVSLITQKTEGLPLYLSYVTNLIEKIPANEREAKLKELSNKIDDINKYYDILFSSISKKPLSIWILAILALRRDYTTTSILVTILELLKEDSNLSEVEKVIGEFEHVLKRIDAESYTIFHNSFREFILAKISKNLISKINEAFICYYESRPEEDETYRNFFRHLFDHGQYQRILSNCNENWLRKCWQNFRPFDEINANLNLAWESSVKIGLLKDFVRIAFLKQQFGVIENNIENVQDDDDELLLIIGRKNEALRNIWNGERVTCSLSKFCKFILRYRECTNDDVPEKIIESGFSKFRKEDNVDKTILFFKARALSENWLELFNEIDQYQWQTSDEDDYFNEKSNDLENKKINEEIKFKMLYSLWQKEKYVDLIEIGENESVSPFIRNQAIIYAINLFVLKKEINEAIRYIEVIDFSFTDRQQYNTLLLLLYEKKQFTAISQYIPLSDPPQLFFDLTKEPHPSGIKDEVFELYNSLRVYFFQNPNGYNLYCLRADNYDMPEKVFFQTIIELSWLWCKTIKKDISEKEKIEKVKTILQYLNVDTKNINYKDLNNYPSFITKDIWRIYKDIFEYVSNYLEDIDIIEVVKFWLILDRNQNRYKNQKTSIEFAKILSNLNNSNLKTSIEKLLKRAEEQARYDEETSSLVHNLIDCIATYGYCKFENDVTRIWNELYELSCGIYYKKDYQFTEIIPMLELTHKQYPEKSKERLGKLLTFAYQLSDAARGKTFFIAIEELINFSYNISPELAFKLLDNQDEVIYRERAIEKLTKNLVDFPDINLWYVWAIIKTMNKWEDYSHYNEETYPTILCLIKKTGETKQWELMKNMYTFTKHQLLVEKNMPERIFEIAVECQQYGLELESLNADIEEFKKYKIEKIDEIDDFYVGKLKKGRIAVPDVQTLQQLAHSNFTEFECAIEALHTKFLDADRMEQLKQCYYDLKRAFNGVYESLETNEAEVLKGKYKLLNKRYFQLKNNILKIESTDENYKSKVSKLFREFMNDSANIITERMSQPIRKTLDYEKILARFITNTDGSDYLFNQYILKPNINRFIEKEDFCKLKKWEGFCKKWLSDNDLGKSLLILAKRFKNLEPEYCKILLRQTWEADKKFFYIDDRANACLGLFFEVAPEDAKGFLLNSFYEHYKNDSGRIIYNLGKIIEFSEHFYGQDIYEDIYFHYEKYVELLATGLSEKVVDFTWVKDFVPSIGFENSVVKYLVCLLDYPQIEIRKLAMHSLFDLINSESTLFSKILNFGIGKSDNIKEHVLNLSFTVSLVKPQVITEQKKILMQFLENQHFNIKQTVKELLLYCKERGEGFESREIEKLKSVNTVPQIILPSIVKYDLQKGERFLPSSFQANLLYNMDELNKDFYLIDKVYTYILHLGWDEKKGLKTEGKTHDEHNINASDSIEINGSYFNIAQKALNEVFDQEIRDRNYDDSDIREIQNDFRLYDPTSILIKVDKKPANINWINSCISDKDYLDFEDIGECLQRKFESDNEWITIYEDGHQRIDERVGNITKTTYFKLIAFMISSKKANKIKEMPDFKNNIFYLTENCYIFEIPSIFPTSKDFSSTEIKPLIGISDNNFREQNDLSIASLLPDLIEKLKLSRESEISLNYHKDGEICVEFLRWQEEFDQGRRRQKAKSEGVVLKIRKEVLNSYLQDTGYTLCYAILLKRSVAKYKSEKDMQWTYYDNIFPLSI